jgi:hypothetical protein
MKIYTNPECAGATTAKKSGQTVVFGAVLGGQENVLRLL